MTRCPPAPLVLSIRSLRKERAQGEGLAYCLEVPRLELRSGEKLLITGPSGCGKSTLLDMIGMVLRPDAVDECLFFPEARTAESAARAPVWDVAAAWAGNEVERLAFWRRHVGYVLQTGGLLPFINVRENILTARRLLGPSQETSLLPEKLIDSLGIRHLLRKLPAQLSVGERQRVAIARALAANPPLVLADEPTAALDPVNAAAVLSLFSQMVDELGASLILVSHAPEQMRGMGFRRLRVRLDAAETAAVGKASTSTRAVLVDDAADQ